MLAAPYSPLKRALLLMAALPVVLTLHGCEIAQERVHITIEDTALANAIPNQDALIEALQQFAESHDTRCRPHIKRVEEWSCQGPNRMHITFKEDLGKDRFVAEFTLVIYPEGTADEFHEYVNEFVGYMSTRFGEAVKYPVGSRT